MTFAELDAAASSAAAQLSRAGLRPADRVLIGERPGIGLFVALAAVLRAGLVAVFVDPGHGLGRVNQLMSRHPPAALIASGWGRWLSYCLPATRNVPLRFSRGIRFPGWQRLCESTTPADTFNYETDPRDPALLTFTSGSTGLPKGIARSHGLLRAQLRILAEELPASPGDVALVTLAMFVLPNLARGVCSVLPAPRLRKPARADAGTLVGQIVDERVTHIVAPPALLDRIADHCARRNAELAGVRDVTTGGGPVFPPRCQRWRAMAPGATLRLVYGSSEAEPIATTRLGGADSESRPTHAGVGLLAGTPAAGARVTIVPDRAGESIDDMNASEFRKLCLPADQIGEIVVSGPHVLPGYVNGSGDRLHKLTVDGERWHRTGDAGYLDYAGRLWLVGRCSARLGDARGTLYPLQVEVVASQSEQVLHSALVGRAGQRLLLVEWRHSPTRADLSALARSVGGFCIDRIQSVRQVPMDRRHNSKVDYARLERIVV